MPADKHAVVPSGRRITSAEVARIRRDHRNGWPLLTAIETAAALGISIGCLRDIANRRSRKNG